MRYSFLFLSVAFTACSSGPADKTDAAASTGGQNQDIPANATREKFADDPEMEKITINDAGGNLVSEGNLVNGKKEGNWMAFHSTGIPKSMTSYHKGKREGDYAEFTLTGQFAKRIAYHNDERHGAYVEYQYPNKKEERNYQNGKLEGIVKIYYPDGKIMEQSSYKNDTRDGISKWYDAAGNVSITYEYKNGVLVKK